MVVGSVIGDEAVLGDGCELRNLAVIGPGAEFVKVSFGPP